MAPDMFRGLGTALGVVLTLALLGAVTVGFLIGRCH